MNKPTAIGFEASTKLFTVFTWATCTPSLNNVIVLVAATYVTATWYHVFIANVVGSCAEVYAPLWPAVIFPALIKNAWSLVNFCIGEDNIFNEPVKTGILIHASFV